MAYLRTSSCSIDQHLLVFWNQSHKAKSSGARAIRRKKERSDQMSGLRRRALFHPQNFKIICKQAFICKLSIIRKPSNQGPVVGSYLPNEPSCLSLVCQKFLKGRVDTLPCSFRSTFFIRHF